MNRRIPVPRLSRPPAALLVCVLVFFTSFAVQAPDELTLLSGGVGLLVLASQQVARPPARLRVGA